MHLKRSAVSLNQLAALRCIQLDITRGDVISVKVPCPEALKN